MKKKINKKYIENDLNNKKQNINKYKKYIKENFDVKFALDKTNVNYIFIKNLKYINKTIFTINKNYFDIINSNDNNDIDIKKKYLINKVLINNIKKISEMKFDELDIDKHFSIEKKIKINDANIDEEIDIQEEINNNQKINNNDKKYIEPFIVFDKKKKYNMNDVVENFNNSLNISDNFFDNIKLSLDNNKNKKIILEHFNASANVMEIIVNALKFILKLFMLLINVIVNIFIKLYKTFLLIVPLFLINFVFSYKYINYMTGLEKAPPKYYLILSGFLTFYFFWYQTKILAGFQLYLINNFIKLFDGTYIDRNTALTIFGIPTNSRFARYKGKDASKQVELFLEVFFITFFNIVIRIAIFALVCKYFLSNGSTFAFSFFPTTREILLFFPIIIKKLITAIIKLSPFG